MFHANIPRADFLTCLFVSLCYIMPLCFGMFYIDLCIVCFKKSSRIYFPGKFPSLSDICDLFERWTAGTYAHIHTQKESGRESRLGEG